MLPEKGVPSGVVYNSKTCCKVMSTVWVKKK